MQRSYKTYTHKGTKVYSREHIGNSTEQGRTELSLTEDFKHAVSVDNYLLDNVQEGVLEDSITVLKKKV